MQVNYGLGGGKLNYNFQDLYDMRSIMVENINLLQEICDNLNAIDVREAYNKGTYIDRDDGDGNELGLGIIYNKDSGLIGKKPQHLLMLYTLQCNQIIELIEQMVASDSECAKLYLQLEFGTYNSETKTTEPMSDEDYNMYGGGTLQALRDNPEDSENIVNRRVEEINQNGSFETTSKASYYSDSYESGVASEQESFRNGGSSEEFVNNITTKYASNSKDIARNQQSVMGEN